MTDTKPSTGAAFLATPCCAARVDKATRYPRDAVVHFDLACPKCGRHYAGTMPAAKDDDVRLVIWEAGR